MISANTCAGATLVLNVAKLDPDGGVGKTGDKFTVECSNGYFTNTTTGNMICSSDNKWTNTPNCTSKQLRILAMYEANTVKISNFWIFWSMTLLIITGQNVQKLHILLLFAAYIPSILEHSDFSSTVYHTFHFKKKLMKADLHSMHSYVRYYFHAMT